MAGLDERVVKITIQVEDQLRTFEGLAIRATGSKYASATQNETLIRIANVDKPTRDFLLTEGTPFNRIKNRKRNRIIVEAGRKSTGTVQIFVGDITTVKMTQPPDIWLEIKAITSQFLKGDVVSRTEPATSNFSTIAQRIANDLGVSLAFEAEDKQVSNYSFSGAVIKQVNALNDISAGVDAFVDDNKLIVKNSNSPVSGRSRPVDSNNGMIGIPEFIDFGIRVTMLLDIETRIGDEIVVKSEVYPAADGRYIIYKLGFDIANRDQPFYYIAEARKPLGVANG